MADRIVVMNAGKIEQIGTPLELYDRPANMFVAGFIGSPSMNFLSGALRQSTFVATDGSVIPIAGVKTGDVEAITLGVRPEHFRLDPQGMAAEVITIEPTGAETQVMMRFAGHEVVGVFRERIEVVAGQTLNISLDMEKLHLFDARTGERT